MTEINNATDLDVAYKGKRDYIQSADIFNEVIKTIKHYDQFTMILNRKMASKLSLVPYKTGADKTGFSGTIYYESEGIEHRFGIMADPLTSIEKRHPYDEPRAIAGYVLDNQEKEIILPNPTEFSFMECVVALNKKLIEGTVSNQIKWAVTKIELNKQPKIGSLKLKLVKNLGIMLTKSAIFVDDILFGYIYFSDFSKAYQ